MRLRPPPAPPPPPGLLPLFILYANKPPDGGEPGYYSKFRAWTGASCVCVRRRPALEKLAARGARGAGSRPALIYLILLQWRGPVNPSSEHEALSCNSKNLCLPLHGD